jgi:RimJ/RimL family protein N-acetyltransferase
VKSSLTDCVFLSLNKIHNRAGNIAIVEANINIPFQVKRVYYLYDIPGGEARGGHSHKQLHQLIVSASGSFTVLLDDGQNKKKVTLSRPDYGILIVPGIWRELSEFSSGAVCLVMASHKFDEKDYIRDYSTFVASLNIENNKEDFKIVDFSIEFLEKSRNWLRDPEIKTLTLTESFSDLEQNEWFDSLSSLNDYYIKGFKINGEPAGAFGLKHIRNKTAEYWGYIGEKKYWGEGYGKLFLSYAIDYAKANKISSIYLKVIDTNTRALNLYVSYGFKFTLKEENIHHMILLL